MHPRPPAFNAICFITQVIILRLVRGLWLDGFVVQKKIQKNTIGWLRSAKLSHRTTENSCWEKLKAIMTSCEFNKIRSWDIKFAVFGSKLLS